MFKKKVKKIIEDIKLETLELQTLSYDELVKISQLKHQCDVQEYDKQQNSLCKIVIGLILIVIGILFAFLSTKKVKNRFVGFDFASLQFYIFVGTLAIGGVLLIYGIIKFIIASKKRKDLKKDILTINDLKKKQI